MSSDNLKSVETKSKILKPLRYYMNQERFGTLPEPSSSSTEHQFVMTLRNYTICSRASGLDDITIQ